MINQKTLDFLSKLIENNNREWFLANKDSYDAAREDVVAFVAELIKHLSKLDPTVNAETDAKKCVMRIYRDIRFSKDKTPYKSHFGVGRLNSGRSVNIGYYLHIEPGKSFIAGGYWMPEGDHLKAIRQEIDYNAADLKKIVDAPDFKALFGEFRDQHQLKTTPGGYGVDNENISLLKLKSFIAEHPLSDAELLKADAAAHIANLCSKIYPLNVFLRNAIV